MSTAILPPLPQTQREELMTRLFSDLQIARFNEVYYQKRATTMRRFSNGANIVAAISSSAVLVGLFSTVPFGVLALKLMTGVAALTAAIGPVLNWSSSASQFEKAALGHGIIRDRLRSILNDLKLNDLEDSHLARRTEISSFSSALTALDEPARDSLRESAWKQVMEELPSERAWDLV